MVIMTRVYFSLEANRDLAATSRRMITGMNSQMWDSSILFVIQRNVYFQISGVVGKVENSEINGKESQYKKLILLLII